MCLWCSDICQKLALFGHLGANNMLQREEAPLPEPAETIPWSQNQAKKKSWQHQLITKPLAANVLGFWLVSAACTRAAGASGWLFKAAGSLDKLNKMSWCHVTMSSSEPASEKTKKEASACYCRETVGVFAQAVVVWRGLLFEMHNCSDVTVKSCHGHVCEKTYGAFLVEKTSWVVRMQF